MPDVAHLGTRPGDLCKSSAPLEGLQGEKDTGSFRGAQDFKSQAENGPADPEDGWMWQPDQASY